ncbi:MAG TPA: hypothetical protein VFY40_29035 [Blastocatellia bacterium]|nr:hypothetical protein [Blastocatellia bacterium]
MVSFTRACNVSPGALIRAIKDFITRQAMTSHALATVSRRPINQVWQGPRR